METRTGGARKNAASRGPGPHLVRCGTSYLFQIRLPIALGGGRAMPPIRIGLGARPASDARRIADLLAAAARAEFARIKARGMSGGKDASAEPGVEPIFSGEDAQEAMAEVRDYLKAFKQIADREAPEPGAQ